jgi:V8-like Glu-specific endopeptidase
MEIFENIEAINLKANITRDITRELLEKNKFQEAFLVLEENISSISPVFSKTISLNLEQFNSVEVDVMMGIISRSNASVEKARIALNLLNLLDNVPVNIAIQQKLGNLKSSIYSATSGENLEKILGPINHIVKINWLQKGIQASKSVCQVLREDGGKGTGFVLKDGYLLTNFHVLPDKNTVRAAKIIFDYEEDLLGNLRKTSEFFLEEDDSKFSPVKELDYAYVKIKNNTDNLLSNWGYLQVDTFSDPQIDNPVTIIQHPLGGTKQIALTANKIIRIDRDRHKLYYQTDTERGSSGSPVFNNEWKVIALHHAGKTEDEGGLVVDDKTGEKRGANEGILIKQIVQNIGKDI